MTKFGLIEVLSCLLLRILLEFPYGQREQPEFDSGFDPGARGHLFQRIWGSLERLPQPVGKNIPLRSGPGPRATRSTCMTHFYDSRARRESGEVAASGGKWTKTLLLSFQSFHKKSSVSGSCPGSPAFSVRSRAGVFEIPPLEAGVGGVLM